MVLLDNPLSRKEISSLLEQVQGNISRICVSSSSEEILCNLGFAVDRLSLIAYSRVKGIFPPDDEL